MSTLPRWSDIIQQTTLTERHMTSAEKTKSKKIAKAIKKDKKGLQSRYGKKGADRVAYATGNKMAMKESEEVDEVMHTATGDMTCEACGADMTSEAYKDHDGLCETCGDYELNEIEQFNRATYNAVSTALQQDPKFRNNQVAIGKIAADVAMSPTRQAQGIVRENTPLPAPTESRPIREQFELFPIRYRAAKEISKLLGENNVSVHASPEDIVNAGMMTFITQPHTLQEWTRASAILNYAKKMKINYDPTIFSIRKIKK